MLNYWAADTQSAKEVLNHSAIGLDDVLIMDTLDCLDLLDDSTPYSPNFDLNHVLMLDNNAFDCLEDASDFFQIQPMHFSLEFELNIVEQ